MPKAKTNKSVAKRFRVTGTAKLKRNKTNKRHLLSARTTKRKRQLRRSEILPASITDGLGRTTRWLLDTAGRPTQGIAADGGVTKWTRDA